MPISFVPITKTPTHLGNFRDPVTGDVTRLNNGQGVPLLPDMLTGARLVYLIKFGSVWKDVSSDVLHNPPTIISLGKPNEAGTAPPAVTTITLKNPARRYSQYDPLSENWPYVRENAPLWIRVFIDGQYYTRFYGEIKGFKQGHDTTGNYSVVSIEATGPTRRISARNTPLKSALYRAITRSTTHPIAYWTLEDESFATAVSSALPGGSALAFSATNQIVAPTFASIDGPGGSNKLPNFTNAGSFTGTINGSSATSWSFAVAVKFPTIADGTSSSVLRLYTASGSVVYWELRAATNAQGGLLLSGLYTDNSSFLINSNGSVNDGLWHWVKVDVAQSGANISLNIYIDGSLAGGSVGWPVNLLTRTLGPIRSIQLNQQQTDNEYPFMGHAAIYNGTVVPDFTSAMNGYAGETALARLTRLCAEEEIPFSVVGYYASDVTMGPQGIDTLMNLLRECELTDSGFLYDGLAEGLQYQGISQRYDQFSRMTFDASAGELTAFDRVPDDFGRVNRFIATRKNGGFAVAENTDGLLGTDAVGVYEASLPRPANYQTDARLPGRANWEVHKGSGRPGFRYPNVAFNLREHPDKIHTDYGWVLTNPGNAITVTPPRQRNNPSEDLRLTIEGWSELLTPLRWEVVPNCSNQEVYDVFKIADPVLGRIQTGGSTIAADAPIGATSLSVTSNTGGILWTTTATVPSDFPFYLDIEGIKVQVTAIVGASSPQTFTVDGSMVTKPLKVGDRVALWKPGVIAA